MIFEKYGGAHRMSKKKTVYLTIIVVAFGGLVAYFYPYYYPIDKGPIRYDTKFQVEDLKALFVQDREIYAELAEYLLKKGVEGAIYYDEDGVVTKVTGKVVGDAEVEAKIRIFLQYMKDRGLLKNENLRDGGTISFGNSTPQSLWAGDWPKYYQTNQKRYTVEIVLRSNDGRTVILSFEHKSDKFAEIEDTDEYIKLDENWYYWKTERFCGGVRDGYWYLKKIIPYSLLEKLFQE